VLTKADIKFACLGREEACTGDPARRVGEEFLFQEKAGINVEVFQRYGVKKVVTACPHCFNTLKNEYPAMGVELEVAHHTQLISTLIDKGSLLAANPQRGEVVLHDPCYLTRVNEEVAAPRAMFERRGNRAGARRPKDALLRCGWRADVDGGGPRSAACERARRSCRHGATTVAVAAPFAHHGGGRAAAGSRQSGSRRSCSGRSRDQSGRLGRNCSRGEPVF